MHKILFAKIEVWIVLLLTLLGCLGAIAFAAAAVDGERGRDRFGALSQVALAAAEIPDTARRMVTPNRSIMVHDSTLFDGKPTGWGFPAGQPPAGLDGYLLLSRYDGTISRHVVELVSLARWEVVRSWPVDAEALLEGSRQASRFSDHSVRRIARFRAIHPWLTEDGGLLIKDHFSPLVRVDACAKRIWMRDDWVFHHSTEADAEGNLWIPSLYDPQGIDGIDPGFYEDAILKVGLDGKILYDHSVARILIDRGMENLLFTNDMYNPDPTHLNDIQPVLADGPYWKAGDLFLSLRNLSMVMLYRPATDEIVWMKAGPWLSQHDVDILDDHRIAVYDNNAQDRGGNFYFNGPSSIMVYDFATDEVMRMMAATMAREDIKTAFAGQFDMAGNGFVMIEDVTNARLLFSGPDDKVAAEYVNRADDGEVYHLGWSRYIDKALGDKVLSNIQKVRCDA